MKYSTELKYGYGEVQVGVEERLLRRLIAIEDIYGAMAVHLSVG